MSWSTPFIQALPVLGCAEPSQRILATRQDAEPLGKPSLREAIATVAVTREALVLGNSAMERASMEIGARLHHLQLLSSDVEKCAAFYERVYGMQVRTEGPIRICTATDRRLIIAPGPANRLGFAAYGFSRDEVLESHRRMVQARVPVAPANSPLFRSSAFMATDPDGNRIIFGVAETSVAARESNVQEQLPARLQHFAVRSGDPSKLIPFYRDVLGFIVSDRVYDEAGHVRACFLRTDSEHHALAIFHAAEGRHDHVSFETSDWMKLRDWADRTSQLGVPIVWGIGRHGPGNDAFFMVRDPDGNLAEISAELEVCDATRSEGSWRHEERTLNLWGGAIMRS